MEEEGREEGGEEGVEEEEGREDGGEGCDGWRGSHAHTCMHVHTVHTYAHKHTHKHIRTNNQPLTHSPFPVQRGGEMSELDDAGTYFDLGPKQMTQVGTYYYLCTRNNNFSNRDQKSKIIVQSNPYSNARVGALGGFVTVSR